MEAVDTSRHVTERMVCKWLLQLMTTVHTAHRHYITLGAIDVTDVLLISGQYPLFPSPCFLTFAICTLISLPYSRNKQTRPLPTSRTPLSTPLFF